MNIIVGATGQVGAHLFKEITSSGFPARAIVRNSQKLQDSPVAFSVADLFDAGQLTQAFKGGTAAFLITPESQASNDAIGDTQQIIENYRAAIQATGIKKIVGLSSIGAHSDGKIGNLLMSKMLEKAFDDLEAEKVFIRPSYYFSNWLGFLETVKQYGVLPTFFPEHLKLDMNAPADVAKFAARIMIRTSSLRSNEIIELAGPQKYSASDVARAFSNLLNKNVTAQVIPKEKWKETLLSVGFTDNAASNLMDMTQAVIDNKTVPEKPDAAINLTTTLEKYLEDQLKNKHF